VSHETIYQSLFVQSRGALRKELHSCLRTGRAMRRAKAYTKGGVGQGQLSNMVMISERPAEVKDRAVPGHWEGDLIFGKRMTTSDHRSSAGAMRTPTGSFVSTCPGLPTFPSAPNGSSMPSPARSRHGLDRRSDG